MGCTGSKIANTDQVETPRYSTETAALPANQNCGIYTSRPPEAPKPTQSQSQPVETVPGFDVEGTYQSANNCLNGNGCSVDKLRAFRLYKKAADAGHAAAQYAYGSLCLSTYDMPSSGLLYLRKSAEQGFSEGICAYGVALIMNNDLQTGMKMLEEAAKKGSHEALYQLGNIWYDGLGGEKDIQKAFNYYKEAKKCGNAEASVMYRKCVSQIDKSQYIVTAKRLFDEGKYSEASELFLIILEGGDASANYFYGMCLKKLGKENACGTYLRDAAMSNYIPAFAEYALVLKNGCCGIRRNVDEAVRYWKMGIEHNDARAMCLYAAHLDSVGEYWSATHFYEKAVDRGCLDALIPLGCMYLDGKMGDDERGKALFYFEDAVKAEINDGYYWSGITILKNGTERQKGVEYLRQGSERGHAKCQYEYGNCLFRGRGIGQDKKRGVQYFEMATGNGCIEAAITLAQCYDEGNGTAQDVVKAVMLYKNAADCGNLDGMYHYGDHLMKGNGIPKDEKGAVRMWKLAAERDHVPSMNAYGNALINGAGVQRNVPLGESIIARASQL